MVEYIGEAKKYKILEKVGEGRTGCVYKAYRLSVSGKKRELVAIKILHEENSVQEIIQEYEVAQRIRSSRLARYYSLEQFQERSAIVMEYIGGFSLQDLNYADMPNEILSYIKREIHLALDDLEAYGSFHGDLSPNNILIKPDGEIKLIDFASHYKNNYQKFGTLHYMPEDHKAGLHQGIQTDRETLDLLFPNIPIKNEPVAFIPGSLDPYLKRAQPNFDSTIAQAKKPLICASAALIFIATVLALIFSKTDLSAQTKGIPITISGTKWYFVEIEGVYRGYLPARIEVSKRDFNLYWYDTENSGQIAIKIPAKAKSFHLHLSNILDKKP